MPPFDAFERFDVPVTSPNIGELSIKGRKGGVGRPLLLLHGYPQSSYLWNRVSPELSEKYTLVIPDLRGYGSSSKPKGSESHVEYSKREMASDMVKVMKHFGFETFDIVAHDRGARVAHRLILDYPGIVNRWLVLDITPTLSMYEKTDMVFAMGYWHWFFLVQPSPGPEDVIMSDPKKFWAMHTGRTSHGGMLWTAKDLEVYQGDFFNAETVHASCEDYRAAATIDLEHDRLDRSQGNKLKLDKLRVLWGLKGMIERMGGAVETWKEYSEGSVEVSGRSIECGHFIPEEQPDELVREIIDFME